MILALNGADFGDFGYVFGKAVASTSVAALQRALRDFGKQIRDTQLAAIGVDGLIGPKTVAATNRVLRQHIGAGQAPAELRTGVLTSAEVVGAADTITKLINTEARRRGFGIYVGPAVADKDLVTGKTAAAAEVQLALKNFGKQVGDKTLAAIVNDGKMGPKTAAAANRMLTVHVGAGQAPANLRTGTLSQAEILAASSQIVQIINTEARRRGFGIYVGPPVTQKALAALKTPPKPATTLPKTPEAMPVAVKKQPVTQAAPVATYIPPKTTKAVATRTPEAPSVPTYTPLPAAAPASSYAPVTIPSSRTYVVPQEPSGGGLDTGEITKWAAIGLGVVALLGIGYYAYTRRRGGAGAPAPAPAVAGFGGEARTLINTTSDFYTDPEAAHMRALKLQSQGAVSVLIVPETSKGRRRFVVVAKWRGSPNVDGLGDGERYKTFIRSATGFESFSRARKRTVDTGLTYDEAQRACAAFNANRTQRQINAGTKMEFTRE